MNMRNLRMLFLLAGVLPFTSCGTFKSYVASYSIGLSEVESPADSKQQFGETKVVSFNEEGVNKYRYEDDYIDIIWYVGLKKFNFTLKNKSGHTLKINWDDVSKHSDKCTFYTLRFDCSFAAANTIKPQLL